MTDWASGTLEEVARILYISYGIDIPMLITSSLLPGSNPLVSLFEDVYIMVD
jgi:hypothetical protein